MEEESKKISLLKDYFEKKQNVLMAFVFGSQVKGAAMPESDWDIGVYFKPHERLELESSVKEYEGEKGMWSDLVDILETNEVDLVVLNRARPVVVYSAMQEGMPLVVRDKLLYLRLLSKAGYEAMDWYELVDKYYYIFKHAQSLTPETEHYIKERLIFLEEQLLDLDKFKQLTWEVYDADRDQRRNVERWVENVVMASIDIAQAFFASSKKAMPKSYKDMLKLFGSLYMRLPEKSADTFAWFAQLRNIVAHEYLDIRWKRIKEFIQAADEFYPKFIEKVEMLLKKDGGVA